MTRADAPGEGLTIGHPSAVLAAAVLFGTTGTAQAFAPRGAPPLGVGAVRLVLGCVALMAIARLRRPAALRWRQHLPSLAAGGVAIVLYNLCWFWGLRRTGVAMGTMLGIGSGPVFAGLLHRARGERLPGGWMAGSGITVAGVVLLVASRADSLAFDPAGCLGMLGAGLSYAAYTLTAKQMMRSGVDSSVAIAAMFAAGAVLVTPVLAFQPLGWISSVRGAAVALYLGTVTIGVAYVLYAWGLSRMPAPKVVTLTLAEPVTAATLGVVVLGEKMGPMGVAGAALVLAGLAVTGLRAA